MSWFASHSVDIFKDFSNNGVKIFKKGSANDEFLSCYVIGLFKENEQMLTYDLFVLKHVDIC